MKVLVLGGGGMLGHVLVRYLLARGFDIKTTFREDGFDAATRPGRFAGLISGYEPDVVVNAIGLIKQRVVTQENMLLVNSVFPHRIAKMCQRAHARFIHVSTDCVFSGETEDSYTEKDTPYPDDLYGRSKLLGEVVGEGCLTIRTSLIGLELTHNLGLVEWFLAQKGEVGGYTRHFFSGVTTVEFSAILRQILIDAPNLTGLWHLASDPICKYELLDRLGRLVCLKTRVVPNSTSRCNRILNGSALLSMHLNLKPSSWDVQLKHLAEEIESRKPR